MREDVELTVFSLIVLSVFFLCTGWLYAGEVNLEWDPNPPEDNVVGYNMYRSLSSGVGYSVLNAEFIVPVTYTDNTAEYGTRYYYVATAVNDEGMESGFSNEVNTMLICVGDANGDLIQNIADVSRILQHIVGENPLTGYNLIAADANEDGSVDIADVTRVLQHTVGEVPLDACN